MCLWLSQARPDCLAEPGMLSHYPIYLYQHSEACCNSVRGGVITLHMAAPLVLCVVQDVQSDYGA